MSDDDLESRLRRTFADRADQAPPAGPVEQRTLATVGRGQRRRRPGWFSAVALRPVAVAASVLAVVGATAGGVALVHNLTQGPGTGAGHVTGSSRSATATATASASVTAPSTAPPTSLGVSAPPGTGSGSAPVTSPAARPTTGPVPAGFTVADLTFVSNDAGWALGTTPTCARTPCTSLVRTTDGGKHWVGIAPPRIGLLNDGCTSVCVSGVRFASPSVGYLFGPNVLYLTTNGGARWVKQSGGATALEISRGNVLRVSTTCSPGCPYVVQMSTIGGSSWHQVLTSVGTSAPVGAGLVREGSTAFVQIYGNPAGGAGSTHAALYRSTDNGANWSHLGEPCPQNAGTTEIDASAMAGGQKGTLAVLCRPRQVNSGSFVATFARGAKTAVGGSPVSGLEQPIGALSTSVVFAQGASGAKQQGELLRSVDGGTTYAAVAHSGLTTGGAAFPGFLGFEDGSTGRWVSPRDPRTVWTTTDAGMHWTSYTFP